MSRFWLYFCLIVLVHTPAWSEQQCGDHGVWLQVLGSGGPEITDQRASSGYLIWHNGKARVLVDMGGGSLLRFEQSGAQVNDLDVILLTHLHVDHSADLPYLIKASFFTGRDRDLPIYGPTGNHLMPSTVNFVQRLLDAEGAFQYLSDYLNGSESYQVLPSNVNVNGKAKQKVLSTPVYRISAIPVHHGPIPALAWRVDLAKFSVVFSGDMNNDYDTLAKLATNADLLVAHNAIPEQTGGVARNLHMPPSVIGKIAARAKVGQLLLSHRMRRTLGKEMQTTQFIKQHYRGPIQFADDLQCFKL